MEILIVRRENFGLNFLKSGGGADGSGGVFVFVSARRIDLSFLEEIEDSLRLGAKDDWKVVFVLGAVRLY
ncbi:hypothetical protein MUK42_36110 [Musa troglodytarum]|uniref:Uncharacterized protein n=1 Tax=Musa troglodytarum TaxID=320322 RepID=A0A9E7JX75_9LILI|nr:hypothetical protein MUK42_36110 [Musa troglodytarum]